MADYTGELKAVNQHCTPTFDKIGDSGLSLTLAGLRTDITAKGSAKQH